MVNGLFYVWPVNATDANTFKEVLGLEAPEQMTEANRAKAITGTRYPRPPKVSIVLEGGGSRTMFCSSDTLNAALAAGWELVEGEIEYGGTVAPAGGGG